MKRLDYVVEGLTNLFGYVSGWLVPLMALLVFFEVFMRYALHQPPMLADEFSAYMLVALCFLGMAYTWKERGHVRITAFVSRLPTKVSNWLRLTTLVIAFIFSLGLCQASYIYMIASFELGWHSVTWLHTPLQGIQMTLPIGYSLLSLVLIGQIAQAIISIRAGISLEGETQ